MIDRIRPSEKLSGTKDFYLQCLYMVKQFGREKADVKSTFLKSEVAIFQHWGPPEDGYIEVSYWKGKLGEEVRIRFDKDRKEDWKKLTMYVKPSGEYGWMWTKEDEKARPWFTVDGMSPKEWIKHRDGLIVLNDISLELNRAMADRLRQ